MAAGLSQLYAAAPAHPASLRHVMRWIVIDAAMYSVALFD